MTELKLDLTDEEWMSVLDMEREGLPYCCANISALRDELLSIARYGGTVEWRKTGLARAFVWAEDSHDFSQLPVMVKIKEQLLADDECRNWYEAAKKLNHTDEELREKEGFG